MKKILPLLLAVMLVVCMAVPCFASSHRLPMLPNGQYENWAIVYISNTYYACNYEYVNTSYNSDWILTSGGKHFYELDNATLTWVELDSGSIRRNALIYDNTGNFDVYSNSVEFYVVECTGETCPANDVNLDGICDDCGRAMTMSLRSPTLESLKADAPYYNYFIYKTVDSVTGAYVDTRLTFVSSASPMTLTKSEWDRLNDSAWGNITYRFTGDSDIDGVNYVSHDGGATWERETTFSNGTTLFNIDENIVTSTFDIFDRETGDLFFPLPLWEMTEQVTQGEMLGMTQTVVGAMKILALCGVGCLALLVVLKLFGKRSLIYRN